MKETAPKAAESPKPSSKNNKQTKPNDEESATPAAVAAEVPAPAKVHTEIPKAIQELMKTAGSNPVAASIIEQFKSDANNNLVSARPAAAGAEQRWVIEQLAIEN